MERRQALHMRMRETEARIRLLETQLQTTQRLATLGTTTCLAAHEFNNLLMLMANWAEQALHRPDDMEFMRRALEKTVQHCNHASRIVESMMSLVRSSASEVQEVDVAELVADSLRCLGRDLEKDGIRVRTEIEEGLSLWTSPGQLQQVVVNLIVNARQAMLAGGGTLRILARGEDGRVRIEVADTGCGMEPAVLERAFEPFFTTKADTTKPDQRGTGLGLAICKDIVEAHGGAISVASEAGAGTVFTLVLPRGDGQEG